MNPAAPFLPQFNEIDRQQAIVDLDNLWGRRIVPLDCKSSLLMLDEDINRDNEGVSQQLCKKLRQHSLLKRRRSSTNQKNFSMMMYEDEDEATFSPMTYEPRFEEIEIAFELPTKSKETTNQKRKKKSTPGTILPADFQPSPYSVIIGKGKESKNVIGNERLRVLASSYLPRYAAAVDDRDAKTELVSNLIATMRAACPVGAFIKLGKDDGRWYEVSDTATREKVGYTFRDLLGDKYRSSSKAKVAMRSLKKKKFSRQE